MINIHCTLPLHTALHICQQILGLFTISHLEYISLGSQFLQIVFDFWTIMEDTGWLTILGKNWAPKVGTTKMVLIIFTIVIKTNLIQFDFLLTYEGPQWKNKNKIFEKHNSEIVPRVLAGGVPEEESEYVMFHCSLPPPATRPNVSSQLTGEAAHHPPPTTNRSFFIYKIYRLFPLYTPVWEFYADLKNFENFNKIWKEFL